MDPWLLLLLGAMCVLVAVLLWIFDDDKGGE